MHCISCQHNIGFQVKTRKLNIVETRNVENNAKEYANREWINIAFERIQ